jgi:hypothetical protein
VFRPGNASWFILSSSSHFTIPVVYQWGLKGDVPVPADFDGDGMLDPAVFRPSTNTWFTLMSGSRFTTALTLQWGLAGDVPVLGRH